ncbi:abortive infection family protein [Candidatus Poriferisodalis sp.]|uniref:abortive infection family protein n=1 Tax=Candidatus Poriferisodalis sp. TaxID=3101277 RepID=UPI003B5B5352
MVGARSAMLDGPFNEAIEQLINAIEDALAGAFDFAFDLSKTLVESVCKTVLADIGQPVASKWDAPKLLRETTSRLALLPRDHPDPAKARDSVEKPIRGLLQTIQGLCELRNQYGMASHGRDGFSARLDLRHATLAAQAADTVVSFLYRTHRDALMQTPGTRVYYEDHADFNDVFDRDSEPIQLGGVELQPSRVLFYGDREAYKAVLIEHLAEQSGAGDGIANGAPGEPDSEAE